MLDTVFYILIILFSAVIHEYMHGWVADVLGDSTARDAGRLTLNPLPHIDPFGTVLLPLMLFFFSHGGVFFAYAKPVPYNPYNLKYPRWGPAMVGVAGPGINFVIAVIFGLAVRFMSSGGLDTSPLVSFFANVAYANIVLGVFNMVPIPPLDGSKLLASLVPNRLERFYEMLENYGTWFLMFFIFFGFSWIVPIMHWLFTAITGTTL